jgi:hypothetical protein
MAEQMGKRKGKAASEATVDQGLFGNDLLYYPVHC